MSQEHQTHPRHSSSWIVRKVRQYWPLIPMLGILFALMLSDLDVVGHMPWSQDPCGLTQMEQDSFSAKMYLPLAQWALRYTPSPRVAIVLIDGDTKPAGLLTNTCESRAFLAKLVQDLNELSAGVIVIDQYFSADYCTEQDKNAKFINSMQTSRVPVVVGQPTHALAAATSSGGCLAPTRHLEFSKAAKVFYGLTRLDADDLKIPLRWPLFTDPPGNATANTKPAEPQQLPAESGDGLALVAARLEDPNIDSEGKVAKFLAKGMHPYTTFPKLSQINAMTIMCSAGNDPTDIFGAKLGSDCDRFRKDRNNLDDRHLNLAGKVVVVGAVSPVDMQPFPTGKVPGVFLQASYVQAILDHRFLTEIPASLTLGFLVAYVFLVYCLYWAHDRKGRSLLSNEQAGLLSISLLALVCLVSIIVLLTTSYFTPLWALWGAGVFIVFRYLEEVGHSRGEHLLGRLTERPADAPHASAVAASTDRGPDDVGYG